MLDGWNLPEENGMEGEWTEDFTELLISFLFAFLCLPSKKVIDPGAKLRDWCGEWKKNSFYWRNATNLGQAARRKIKEEVNNVKNPMKFIIELEDKYMLIADLTIERNGKRE